MKQIRLKDVAERAGVSIGTVDRVLHNRGEVKKETKEKVLAIAKELNYRPNSVAQALKSPKVFKVSVLIPEVGESNQFWTKHPIGIQNAVEQVHPYQIDLDYFTYDIHDSVDFSNQCMAIQDIAPDGVILAPILKNESYQFCCSLDKLNVPYVFIDTYIDETNCRFFVGEDAVKSGRVAASLIDFGIDKKKDVLIVNIAKDLENVQHLSSRNQGFMSYFLNSGKNTGMKLTVDIKNDIEVGQVMDQVLSKHDIGGILVSGSRSYSIAQYIHQNKLDVFVVGYEVFDKNIEYLKNRAIDFLIGQRPVEQGYRAFEVLFRYISGQIEEEKLQFQPIDIINLENYELFQ